ncbi:Hypothetical protein HVR_LOCUS1314, partial [uncultured virus]
VPAAIIYQFQFGRTDGSSILPGGIASFCSLVVEHEDFVHLDLTCRLALGGMAKHHVIIGIEDYPQQ